MKLSTVIAVIFLAIIALGHGMRLIGRVPIAVGSMQIPIWISGTACIFCALLAIWLWKDGRKPANRQ